MKHTSLMKKVCTYHYHYVSPHVLIFRMTVDLSFVTYGSMLKLRHENTGYRLHSHEVSYGSGSKQQSVTAVSQPDDVNSFWILKAAHGFEEPQGYVDQGI